MDQLVPQVARLQLLVPQVAQLQASPHTPKWVSGMQQQLVHACRTHACDTFSMQHSTGVAF